LTAVAETVATTAQCTATMKGVLGSSQAAVQHLWHCASSTHTRHQQRERNWDAHRYCLIDVLGGRPQRAAAPSPSLHNLLLWGSCYLYTGTPSLWKSASLICAVVIH